MKLFVQPVSGGPRIQIGRGCTWINASSVWSPDSRRVLFEGSCDQQLNVWTFSIADMHLEPRRALFHYLLDNDFRAPNSIYQYPAFVFHEWIPNPSRLFLSQFRGDTNSSVALPISADGSRTVGGLQTLTFGPDDEYRLSVASTGRMVLSTTSASPQVWSLPIDENAKPTGDPQQLTFDGSARPSLSTDGRTLAVSTNRGGGWEVQYINLSTRKQRPVAAGVGGIGSHLISRLGEAVFYVVGQDGKFTLFQESVSGGLPQRLREGRFLLGDQSVSGRMLLGTTDGKRHGITAFDIQTREQRELLVDPDARWLWVGAISNDDQWTTFTAVSPGHSQIYIAPFRTTLVAPSEWIAITDGSAWDDTPRFSHDHKFLIFTSDRDGRRCIWADRLGPDLHPLGEPFPVQHFHNSRRSIANSGISPRELSVGPKIVAFEQTEFTGNVSLLEPGDH